jgi:hypothetical protein
MEIEKWVGQKLGDRVVASVEKAFTPLGNGQAYTKAVSLVLDDGSIVYGCTWAQDDCAYVADNPTTIASGHFKAHEVTPDMRRVPFKDWTLEQILGRLLDSEADLKKVMDQRDRAIQAKGNTETVAQLRQELKEANGKVRDYEKAMKLLRGLMAKSDG